MGGCLDKMVLGIGSYGHTYTLSDSTNTDIGAPVSGPGNKGPYTQNEVCHLKQYCIIFAGNWMLFKPHINPQWKEF